MKQLLFKFAPLESRKIPDSSGGLRKMIENDEKVITDRFLPNRSKINKKIRSALNNPTRSRYAEIESGEMKNAKTYGINLPKEKIKILK